MFPFPSYRPPSPEAVQREKIAQGAKDLKDYLSKLSPEARAKFWADIEGKGHDEQKQKPSGN